MNRFRTLDTEEERAMMERAAYLEAYAERRNLPVRLNTAVDQLERDGSRYVVRQPSALGRHPDRAEGSAQALVHGGPLIRVEPKDLTAAGIERVPRVAGTRDGQPQLEDGRVLDVANVVWCTGFGYDFSWIRIPVVADHGLPTHQ